MPENDVRVTFDLSDFEALAADVKLMESTLRPMWHGMQHNLGERLRYWAKRFSGVRAASRSELRARDYPYARRHGGFGNIPYPTEGHIGRGEGTIYHGWTVKRSYGDPGFVSLRNVSQKGHWVLGGTPKMLPRPTMRYVAMAISDDVTNQLSQQSVTTWLPIWGSSRKGRKIFPKRVVMPLDTGQLGFGPPAALGV